VPTLIDVIRLGKPRITWLLVYTAIATYIYAAEALNPLYIALLIVAGTLTVFGSNALNSYIDRDIDRLMERTSLRPIPQGAIMPSHAILLGVAWLTLGTGLFLIIFNPWAALSALIGGLYYVFVYTVILKKRTIWNTVIGGWAGSMPTITGWLAAGRPLTVEPLILAIIVFLWTPGHFWSLAYRVREEYRRAGLPMLPSVRDPGYTKRMIILFYLLTAASILISTIYIYDPPYLLTAYLSTILLVYASYIIYRRLDEETAWRSFKISSPTLALLYTGLIVSRLLP